MADLENNSPAEAPTAAAESVATPDVATPAAASSATAAPETPARPALNDLWNKISNPAVAAPVSANPTPEKNAETVIAPNLSKDAPEPAAPAADSSDTAPAESTDSLADLEPKRIPTDEEIDSKTGKYARVPSAIREDLKMFATEARKAGEMIEKLGGEVAMPVYEKISEALFAPAQPSKETATSLLEAVASVNAPLLAQVAGDVFQDVWELPDWSHVIDAKLQDVFGTGYDKAKLAEVVSWMNAGLFDENEMREQFNLDSEVRSPKMAAMQKELDTLRRASEQAAAKQQTDQMGREQYLEQAGKISTDLVIEKMLDATAVTREKIGWEKTENEPAEWSTAKDTLAAMNTAYLEKLYRDSPERKNIDYLINSGRAFDGQGNPTQAFQIQVGKLEGKAKAAQINAARALQPTFTRSFATTRNASLAQLQQQNETAAQANTGNPNSIPPPHQQTPPPTGNQPDGNRRAPTQEYLDTYWKQNVIANASDERTRARLAAGR